MKLEMVVTGMRVSMKILLLVASMSYWYSATALADNTSTRLDQLNAEVQKLKAGQEAIQNELKEIKKLLKAQVRAPTQPPRPATNVRNTSVTLDVADAPQKGSESARLMLIEFTDYQCPYCGRHVQTVMPEIEKNFIATGQLRYALRDFPLPFHNLATKAHYAAHCASEQDRYWEMHDQLFANQKALQPDRLTSYAEVAGVPNLVEFQACMDDDRYMARTKKGIEEGTAAGVNGTPSFLLGFIEANGHTVKATKFIRGAQKYDVFEKAINELLAGIDE